MGEDMGYNGSPYDITSPTDSVIGADFQGLTAEEQERQREEWKAELKKTEEEILTLKQVLTAKERHAAGLKRRLGITAWREFSEDMTQGLKNLQESATYKRTAENLQFAKDIAKEKTSGIVTGITASGYFQSMSSKMSEAYGAAKTKMTTSMSQQTFDEALNEHNGTTPAASEPVENKYLYRALEFLGGNGIFLPPPMQRLTSSIPH